MPATTPCRAYPYPLDGDPIDVAGDINKLARAVDTDVCAMQQGLRFAGFGGTTGSQLINPDTNPNILWVGEAYDTDGFHVAGSADVIIPAGFQAVYACNLYVAMNDPAVANCLSRLVLSAGTPGASIRQQVIPPGQVYGNVSYTGPLAAGTVIRGTFWNNAADPAHFIAASLEIVRVGSF